MTLDELKAHANSCVLDVCQHLFPRGKRVRAEWCVGDIDGSPGQSLKINVALKPGVFKDFANELVSGDNALELWRQRYNLPDILEAARDFAAWASVPFERTLRDGEVVEDQTASGVPVDEPRRNGTHRPRRETNRPPRETPVRKPEPPAPEFEAWPGWDACVANVNDTSFQRLADERGLRIELVRYLNSLGVLGIFLRGDKPHWALPVIDAKGKVIACHYRTRHPDWTGEGCTNEKGKPIKKHAWSYEPTGRSPQPLIIGDPAKSSKVWVFESQWDAFAVMDAIHLDEMEQDWSQLFCILVTRGASNGKLVRRLAVEGKTLILWPQNDEPDDKGRVPSELWVTSIMEEAGQCPVRRVEVPKQHADPNDWIKAEKPAADVVLQLVQAAKPVRESKLPVVRDLWDYTEPAARPVKPLEVVAGLLHRGSKLIIGGQSKARKSYSLLDLGLSVATGAEWWGFRCARARVLYLNFEIQEPFLVERIFTIAEAKKVPMPRHMLHTMTLRGIINPVEDMAGELVRTLLEMEPFGLVIFDPIYKLMGGKDENKAGDVTTVLNHLEHVAVKTGAAVAFGAHYSKGNQAGKDSIDRIGGSGAFARDPDAILTLTDHEAAEQDGIPHFTVEPTLRNFAPVTPFVIRWDYPLFVRDDTGLDPAALKLPKTGRERREAAEGGARANAAGPQAMEMLFRLWEDGTSWRTSKAIELGAHKLDVTERVAKKYFYILRDKGHITQIAGQWTTTPTGQAFIDRRKAETAQAEADFQLNTETPQQ